MTTSHEHEVTATRHAGGCHCGAVRYEANVDATTGGRCNCSICTMVAQTGSMVKPDAFTLMKGEDALGTYAFSPVSTRYFCKHCGIHCFGRGHLKELGGDFVSVNLNTIDGLDPSLVRVVYWDGRHDNWQAGPGKEPWPVAAPGRLQG